MRRAIRFDNTFFPGPVRFAETFRRVIRHARPCAIFAAFLLVTSALAAEDTPAPATPPAEPANAITPNPPALSPSNGPALTLDECVAQALEKNFSVRIQKFSTEQAKDAVTIAKAGYDPNLTATANRSFKQAAASGSTLDGSNTGLRTNTTDATIGLSQKIPTGATATLGTDLNKNATNSAFSTINPAYTGNVSLFVTQPLLKNAGLDDNLAAIKRAKLGVQIADLNFKSTVLTVIFNVETAYYNLIFAREQYKVQEDSLRLAQQLYDENTIKRQTGVLTDLDVLQAQVGVATARSQLILDEQTVHNDEDVLLQSLSQRDFRGQVGPVDFPPMENNPEVSFDLSYKLARDNGPDLAIIQATIEQFKLDALTTKRNALPELDIDGGVGLNSLGHSYNTSINQVPNDNGHSWQAGVTLTFPLGLRANRALYHQALASQHSEETSFEQEDENLTVKVRSAVRAVQTGIESVRASTETATLSQKQYELEKAKFDAGLVTSFDVLQEQNALLAARVQELQAKVNLRTAIANLRFLEGSSLQLYHVNLLE